jgi:thioredoxin 1
MNEVIHIHEDADFEKEVLKSPIPVLVDFSSVLCGPCNRLLPVLNELASDLGDTGKVVAVEVTMNERLVEQYRIAALPTLIVFRSGREIHRMVGMKSKDYLREALAA